MARALTVASVRVAAAFLASTSEELWGHQIAEDTGLKAGTLYPILHRFEAAGWLSSRLEDIDPAIEGRNARRYYRLTPDGVYELTVLRESLIDALALRPLTGGAIA